jgi:GNAT superfamily N-acetyltransferase
VASDRHRFEPLGPHHDRASFSCGVQALDAYLQRQANQDARRNVAAVFVLHDIVDERIVGYYTLSATAVALVDLPLDVTRRLPRYPSLPAILLGRLAVDTRYRGQGFGEVLLFDALRRALAHTTHVAAMAVVVDAKDAAARSFYERYGFRLLGQDQRRLFLSMTAVAQLVDL